MKATNTKVASGVGEHVEDMKTPGVFYKLDSCDSEPVSDGAVKAATCNRLPYQGDKVMQYSYVKASLIFAKI